jgi:hypothetical protein
MIMMMIVVLVSTVRDLALASITTLGSKRRLGVLSTAATRLAAVGRSCAFSRPAATTTTTSPTASPPTLLAVATLAASLTGGPLGHPFATAVRSFLALGATFARAADGLAQAIPDVIPNVGFATRSGLAGFHPIAVDPIAIIAVTVIAMAVAISIAAATFTAATLATSFATMALTLITSVITAL